MMMLDPNREQLQPAAYSPVVLLLGAGASVEAGAPTVTQLVERFATYVRQKRPNLWPTYHELRSILQTFEPVAEDRAVVDVELLMPAITMLIERQESPLSAFTNTWKSFVKRNEKALPQLRDALQEHIRQECTISADRIDYLRPLGDFIRHFGRLDIFTLNYDAAIELTLRKEEFSYTDGFDVYWNSSLLDSTEYQARLFKLHGSLLWFVTTGAPGRLVKIPVKTATGLPEFFSDEQVSHNLIYPVLTKEQHVEPYATLMNHLRQALSQATVLIAVGFSFRDTYLKQVVIERMLQNRTLRLVVVDPDPRGVLERSDRIVDQRWAFKSVAGSTSTLALEAGAALSGRLLFHRTLEIADLTRLQDEHVRGVLQKQGTGPTDGYLRALIRLNLLPEFCDACDNRSTGEAIQDAALTYLKAAGPSLFARAAPVAVYLATNATRDDGRDSSGEWLRQSIRSLAQHVGYMRDSRHAVFLGGGSKVIPFGDAGALFARRRQDLHVAVEELTSWLPFMSPGVPVEVVTKTQALIRTLQAFRDYFSQALADLPGFTNLRIRQPQIQVPLADDQAVLAAMSEHFDAAGEPAIIAFLVGSRR